MNWWQPKFWASLLYALLSRYGSSFMLPLFWWLLTLAVFAGIYTHYHLQLVENSGTDGDVGIASHISGCYQQAFAGGYDAETARVEPGVPA